MKTGIEAYKWSGECPECGQNIGNVRDFYNHMKNEHGWLEQDFEVDDES